MAVGAASALGAVVAAAALSGCTSSAQPTAGGHTTTSAAATATTATTTATTGTTAAPTTTASTAAQPSESTTTTAAAASTACTDTELKVTTSSAGVGLGHSGWIVVFTNVGSAACSVRGYPGAGVTDQPGDVVLNATRALGGYIGGQYASPATIMLEPGAAASTVLEWVDFPPNGQTPVGANCPGMDGGHVLITPPNTQRSTPFPAPAFLCMDFLVHPVVAGKSGRGVQ